MSDDLLKAATQALKEETGDDAADGRFTRARVMASLHQGKVKRRTRLAFVLPIAACLAAGTAWGAATGRLPAMLQAIGQMVSYSKQPPAAPPVKQVPPAATPPAEAMSPAPVAPEPAPLLLCPRRSRPRRRRRRPRPWCCQRPSSPHPRPRLRRSLQRRARAPRSRTPTAICIAWHTRRTSAATTTRGLWPVGMRTCAQHRADDSRPRRATTGRSVCCGWGATRRRGRRSSRSLPASWATASTKPASS